MFEAQEENKPRGACNVHFSRRRSPSEEVRLLPIEMHPGALPMRPDSADNINMIYGPLTLVRSQITAMTAIGKVFVDF